ncbi:hypothetical protein [Streptomyces xanthophaeus]
MRELAVSDLQGKSISRAMAVKYQSGDEHGPTSGLELLLKGGGSILLWPGSDLMLRVSEGLWPEVPDWCWPPEDWSFESVEWIGEADLDEIVSASEVYDEMGELFGVRIGLPAGSLTVKVLDTVTWEIVRSPRND